MGGAKEAPCRLFVYLAREAPLGIVLRRGPSAWTRLSIWHTDTDSIEHGQWLKGRVYERRSDVSANGALFVYFARQSGGRGRADSWVAISRPPWFTALALWFVGGTYYTGGFFSGRHSLSLGFGATPPDQGRLPRWLTVDTSLPPYVDRTNNWTERTVHVNRLLRDGWQLVPDAPVETWELPHPNQPLTLVMTQERAGYPSRLYGGLYLVEYALRWEPHGQIVPLGRATWAGWDHGGRLVIAQDGRLFHWPIGGTRLELADFNPQTPDPHPSPGWAATWP